METVASKVGDSRLLPPPASRASEEDVVISGISGRLPESETILEFQQHLMNGIDMVTEDDRRWEPGLFGLPKRSGKLKDISKFDASFFGIHPKQAHTMDPQVRMLLEVTYESIVDAGVNPASVRGTKTGVYIGCSGSQAHEAYTSDPEKVTGYEMTGCTNSMFANRISYFFDFRGPSCAIDTACSSSIVGLDQAVQAMRLGICDAAIVGGCNLCIKPATALQFQKLSMLSPDGTCKSFDASGNGYCRSEGIVTVYLQQKADAKRIYATIVHSKTNTDGNKEQGITFPSGEVQKQLLTELYTEARVDPTFVKFVEAHGTGTKAGDSPEVNSLAEVFCKKRRERPLLVGSTKSNMGHAECASGMASLAKVLIAMEKKTIPGNLHYNTPNADIPGLVDGRLQVVVEPTKWAGGYVGVNAFGFGGSNAHVLLKSNQIKQKEAHSATKCPRLFTFSGRTQEALEYTLNQVQKHSDNLELQALLQPNSFTSSKSHPYRGYTVLNTSNKTLVCQKCVTDRCPLWFVFSGMGTQWHGMGRDLMSIDVYRESIMKSDEVLRPHGLALYDMLMKGDETTFNNICNSFVSIIAIQVAMVDTLLHLGIEPDGIVGHSVGELGCAYADGGLTAAEAVLAAYWRGRCVIESNLPPGGMAAVGLSWQEARDRCPSGVVPACHNAADTVTVSGAAEAVKQFVEQLKSEGVFAKEVNSAGVAFHSDSIAEAAPALYKALLKVIKEPRLRTKRWISSSIPEDRWESDLAQYSSASYHVNNLVSPVLFQEALQHVPSNAITIEIAPHCLLQAILKRSLGSACTFVGLMKRNHPDNMEVLLSSLGKIYMKGADFDPLKLFPPVDFPISPGTPMISPFIKWNHSDVWNVPKVEQFTYKSSGAGSSVTFEVDTSLESEDNYLLGHVIDGRILYPAAGYLKIAWRALALQQGEMYSRMPVVFENVILHRATVLPISGIVRFYVNIIPESGQFQISENNALVVSGRIFHQGDNILQVPLSSYDCQVSDLPVLSSSDLYRELRLRGYDYGPEFQGIISASNTAEWGKLSWTGNWVTLIDNMLQMQVLNKPGRAMHIPTKIKALRIDPETHLKRVTGSDNQQSVKVVMDTNIDTSVAGGVEMLGVQLSIVPRRQGKQLPTVLEEQHFVPYIQRDLISEEKRDQIHHATTCEMYIRDQLQCLLKSRNVENMANLTELQSYMLKENISDKDSCDNPNDNNSCILLEVLQEAFRKVSEEDFLCHARATFKNHKERLLQDKLFSNLLNERVLKPCLDVVTENSPNFSIKIVEYDPNDGQMLSHIISQLSTTTRLQVDYVTLNADVSTDATVELKDFTVENAQWNLEGSPPSRILCADLVVVSSSIHKERDLTNTLNQLSLLLKDGGFLLAHVPTSNFTIPLTLFAFGNDVSESTIFNSRTCGPFLDEERWCDLFRKNSFELVALKTDGIMQSLFLCRKCCVPNETRGQIIIDVSDANFRWVDDVKEAILSVQAQTNPATIILKADCPQPSGVVGMVNCLRLEEGGERIRCILRSDSEKHGATSEDIPDLPVIMKKDLVMNVFRDGQWGSFRQIPLREDHTKTLTKTTYAQLKVLTIGDLSSMRWIESPLKYSSTVDLERELCTIYYCPINFRDVMLATGKLSLDTMPGDLAQQDCILGMEFSGKDGQGKNVMGILPSKGLATMVDAYQRNMWPVPDRWTLEEAATVPVVYATAYYALVVRGRIKKGDRVLIHSGSGGVGQAAIALALHYGCEVYTTVGSAKKKQFLMERFPQLSEHNFANSRDNSFEWHLMRVTKGKGVDVVLNSLADEKLQASLRLLAQHGRFLEIGKFDLSNNTPLGMSIFLKNITFHGILLDALFDEGNKEWEEVSALISRGIAEGVVRPLTTTVFDSDNIEAAFRFMAQGKHIGKVVIKIRSEDRDVLDPHPLQISAIPKTFCHPEKIYFITGGLGGVGMELAHWLIERGAQNLILTSRSGVKTGYQSRCIRKWREAGINVLVLQKNVAVLSDTEELLRDAMNLGVVGGIFHLAAVLKDGLMENQTVENFQIVCEPKVSGTLNLDKVSRQMCREGLDWFAVFSSMTCVMGLAGQANYGYANSVMDRICERRKRDGLPGLSIQWGAIADVGIVLDKKGSNDTVVGGSLPQRITSCMNTLDQFLRQPHPVVACFVRAELTTKSDTLQQPGLVDAVAHILGLGINDVKALDPSTSLGELGLDSLMGVEVRQTLKTNLDVTMPLKEIRSLTITRLFELAGYEISLADQPKPNTENEFKNHSTTSLEKSPVDYNIDRVIPRETIVRMASAVGGNVGAKTLFVVHPLEGTVASLTALMTKVKRDVYGLQCTQEVPRSSLTYMASFYLSKIKEIQNVGPYCLAGYSFGASVAFEMALQLQQKSETTSLIMLEGTPSSFTARRGVHKTKISVDDMAQVETDILSLLIRQFIKINNSELKDKLIEQPDWDSRNKFAMGHLAAITGMDSRRAELEEAARSFLDKIMIGNSYKPDQTLQCDVTLIRTDDDDLSAIGYDYGLSKVCSGNVTVHMMKGDHETFILGNNADAVAKIINGHK